MASPGAWEEEARTTSWPVRWWWWSEKVRQATERLIKAVALPVLYNNNARKEEKQGPSRK